MPDPEQLARRQVDAALERAGWVVQDRRAVNIRAACGVAVREFPLPRHGEADYLLFANGQAVGAVEAKKQGTPLTGVEIQTAKYSEGLPPHLPAPVRPLPFLYESTGVETHFTNRLDPDPRARPVFAFHRPDTLAEWATAAPLKHAPIPFPTAERQVAEPRATYGLDAPSTLRGRIRAMPPVH